MDVTEPAIAANLDASVRRGHWHTGTLGRKLRRVSRGGACWLGGLQTYVWCGDCQISMWCGVREVRGDSCACPALLACLSHPRSVVRRDCLSSRCLRVAAALPCAALPCSRRTIDKLGWVYPTNGCHCRGVGARKIGSIAGSKVWWADLSRGTRWKNAAECRNRSE